MENRIKLSYEEIVGIALKVINDDMNSIYEYNEKEKAEIAIRISGIIDLLNRIDYATRVTNKGYQE